jgi:hypothetical protein
MIVRCRNLGLQPAFVLLIRSRPTVSVSVAAKQSEFTGETVSPGPIIGLPDTAQTPLLNDWQYTDKIRVPIKTMTNRSMAPSRQTKCPPRWKC